MRLAVIAMAESGSLLHAPDCYMEKIAIGGGFPPGTVDLDLPAGENIRQLAKAKGVAPADITACILDRPRHAELIDGVRESRRGHPADQRRRCGRGHPHRRPG